MSSHDTPWTLPLAAPLEPALVCLDIVAMRNFYSSVLGMQVLSDAEALATMSARFGVAPAGYRIVRLEAANGDRLKLVQAHELRLAANEAPGWVFGRHGIAYLTFIVNGVDDVVRRLSAHQVSLVTPEPVPVRPGFRAIFARDPEGNFLEFVEYEDLAAYRGTAAR